MNVICLSCLWFCDSLQ